MRNQFLFFSVVTAGALLYAASGPDGWPHWRGPNDNGMAGGDAPLHWSDTEHVAWKAAVPGHGNSSPVAWGDRIFLTTAVPTGKGPVATEGAAGGPPPGRPPGPPPGGPPPDGQGPGFGRGRGPGGPPPGDGPPGGRPGGGPPGGPGGRRRGGSGGSSGPQAEQKFELIAYDRKTGKQFWERVATVATPHEGVHPRYGSFASNSPVTDGKHVIAFFGSRGIYCYTLDGELVWKKDTMPLHMNNSFGEGAWPALDGNKLVVVLDQMGESFLLALDKTTGKELWRTPRQGATNWSGPLITSFQGRKQIIVSATQKVCAYDLETGKQIWEATGLGANTIPAPVAADGMVFVMSGFRNPNLMAIKLGREGDLTGTDAIVWQNQRGNSYTPSPVLYDGKLYVLTDNGMLSCFDAKTGKAFYQQQRLPKPYNFKASPVGVNGKLYLASEDGDVIVVKMGETFEVLATNTLEGQTFIGSPAIVDGAIYLRGQNTLFCIR